MRVCLPLSEFWWGVADTLKLSIFVYQTLTQLQFDCRRSDRTWKKDKHWFEPSHQTLWLHPNVLLIPLQLEEQRHLEGIWPLGINESQISFSSDFTKDQCHTPQLLLERNTEDQCHQRTPPRISATSWHHRRSMALEGSAEDRNH